MCGALPDRTECSSHYTQEEPCFCHLGLNLSRAKIQSLLRHDYGSAKNYTQIKHKLHANYTQLHTNYTRLHANYTRLHMITHKLNADYTQIKHTD